MLHYKRNRDTPEALSFLISLIVFFIILLVSFVLFAPLIASQPNDPLSIITGVIIVDLLILLLLVFLPKDILTLAVVGIVFLTSLILTPLLISGDLDTALIVVNNLILVLAGIAVVAIIGRIIVEKKTPDVEGQ